MSKALIPAIVIAANICEDMGDSGMTKQWQALKKMGIKFKEIHLFINPEVSVKTCILPLNQQIELPKDFIYETKVGVMRGGRLVTLTLNKDLRPNNLKVTDTDMELQVNGLLDGSINASVYYPFYNVWRGGNFIGELYGFGSGFHTHTYYNIQDGVLEISSILADIGGEVVIEYKSSGIEQAYRLIPSEWEECIMDGAKSLMYADSQSGKAADFERKYKEKWLMLKRMYSQRSPNYLAWLMRSSNSYGPK